MPGRLNGDRSEQTLPSGAPARPNTGERTEAPVLPTRDQRRLLANSVFHGRHRPDPNAMMMSISQQGPPGGPTFVWFGDAPFADLLDQHQTISCIPSGRIRFSEPATFITAMAARCCEEITSSHPTGDLIFGGFCFDAWIAYETALQLARSNRRVERIIMVETYTLDPFEERFNTVANHIHGLVRGPLTQRLHYARLLVSGCWRKLRPKADESPGPVSVEDEIEAEIMVVTHDAINAYGEVPSAQAVNHLFGAESWHARYYRFAERVRLDRAGWHRTLRQPFSVQLTPGNHDTILDQGNIEDLARVVQATIEDVKLGLDQTHEMVSS